MKKKDALEKLWSELESNPSAEDKSAREAKMASLMAALPDAAGATPAPATARGFGRIALRYAWAPLAAAAGIAAVLILHRSSDTAAAPEILLAEASAASNALAAPLSATVHSATPVRSATPAHPAAPVLAATPALAPVAPTAPAPADAAPETTAVPASTDIPDTGPDPWKMMEEEDGEEAAKASAKRRPSIAFFGARGASESVKGAALPLSSQNYATIPGEASYGYLSDNTQSYGEPAVHDLPLNFGLSLRIPIAGRLSVETGLSYSYLHSSERQLHYLGLPLFLQFDLIRGKHANVYVSGGGSLAYCVTGGGREHPWQTAATVSAGAEYRIFGGVSLFGEGSFNHYFDDGSPLETYYGLNPDTPSFKLGLRFSLMR